MEEHKMISFLAWKITKSQIRLCYYLNKDNRDWTDDLFIKEHKDEIEMYENIILNLKTKTNHGKS